MAYIKLRSTSQPHMTYYAQCDITVFPGDLVVYECVGNGIGYGTENKHRPSYHVGKVEIIGQHQSSTTNHVMYRISLGPYLRRKKRQEELEKIYARIAHLRSEFNDLAFLQTLAENNDEARDLLNRLNSLRDNYAEEVPSEPNS